MAPTASRVNKTIHEFQAPTASDHQMAGVLMCLAHVTAGNPATADIYSAVASCQTKLVVVKVVAMGTMATVT
jgi:hypothetical protein